MKTTKILVLSVFLFVSTILLCFANTQTNASSLPNEQNPSYPIDSEFFTTLQRTVIAVDVPATSPLLLPYELPKYNSYGYGNWQFGAGVAVEKRLDIMPAGYNAATVSKTAKLLRFFTITDIHLTDEESPVQAVYLGYKGGNSSAYSGVMLYSTQVLDAAIQTINVLHKQNPIDFGISLGDDTNNSQYNEVRWFIDILDGKRIIPDSGVKDDPITGPYNDYQDEFQAAGLDATIPWYQVIGNHDHFGMGSYPVTEYIRQTYIGEEILNMGDVFKDPRGLDARGFYMGSLDGRTVYGDVIGAGPVEDFASAPLVLAADPNRRSLTIKEYMSEFFLTSSNRVGHGFTQTNIDNDFACYTFDPIANLPIRVIVLDDTQRDEDFDLREQGYLDKARYDWLVSELDKGQAEGMLLVIAAHLPIPLIGLTSNSYVTAKKLVETLQKYPNLILWISGHVHRNTVTVFQSPEVDRPELGFWQVETSSLRDFPQQFRVFDLYLNTDHTISIFTTNVDTAIKDGSLAAISRTYAIASEQIFKNPSFLPPSGSYNAELVKQLTPEMQTKMHNYELTELK